MDPILEVEIWPARRAPFRALTAALWTVGVATLAYLWAGLVGGVFTFFLLVAWLADFWFPWRIRLDGEGVTLIRMGKAQTLRWGTVRRVVVAPEGILFSPFARPRFLERYRGIWVPFPPEDLVNRLQEVYDGPIQRISG